MVGIINPNDKKTLDDYKKRASGLARGVTPGKSSYGGEMGEGKSATPTGGNSNDKGDKGGMNAAGALRAPIVSVVAILGVIAYAA